MDNIHLALVDDDELVLQLLTDYFISEHGFVIDISETSGNSFITAFNKLPKKPAIILLDLRMENGDGFSVIRSLKEKGEAVKIIVLSSYAKPDFIGQMLKLGVNAFVPKQIDKKELAGIIKEVHEKGSYFSPEQIEVLRNQITPKSPQLTFNPKDQLTTREIEVLELICQQLTTAEIGDRLFISAKAVENRKSHLMEKLNVKNTAGLIISAVKYDLIDPKKML